jgi:hypothetical protein
MKKDTEATITTWAEDQIRWHARLDFAHPQGNTSAALHESAMRARAHRAIKKELVRLANRSNPHTRSSDIHLRLEVCANQELPSGGLISITYREV